MIPKICRNLRKVRLRLGYTLKEVAEGLDYTFSYISKLERGKEIPNRRHIILFSKFYVVTVDEIDPDFEYFFTGKDLVKEGR